jgi:hypothetical protein
VSLVKQLMSEARFFFFLKVYFSLYILLFDGCLFVGQKNILKWKSCWAKLHDGSDCGTTFM